MSRKVSGLSAPRRSNRSPACAVPGPAGRLLLGKASLCLGGGIKKTSPLPPAPQQGLRGGSCCRKAAHSPALCPPSPFAPTQGRFFGRGAAAAQQDGSRRAPAPGLDAAVRDLGVILDLEISSCISPRGAPGRCHPWQGAGAQLHPRCHPGSCWCCTPRSHPQTPARSRCQNSSQSPPAVIPGDVLHPAMPSTSGMELTWGRKPKISPGITALPRLCSINPSAKHTRAARCTPGHPAGPH